MSPENTAVDRMEEDELLDKLKRHVQGKDFRFNPDEKVVMGLVKAMVKKREKTGDYYCPCRVVTGDIEEDKKIVCPCYYHPYEIERDGFCHCHLFVKKDDQDS